MLGLLGRLSAHRPVVHVVEDVQWADRSTLDLLAFLATNLVDERVLVVLTHRTDAVGDDRLVPGWPSSDACGTSNGSRWNGSTRPTPPPW